MSFNRNIKKYILHVELFYFEWQRGKARKISQKVILKGTAIAIKILHEISFHIEKMAMTFLLQL